MLKTTLALTFALAVPTVAVLASGDAEACAMVRRPQQMLVASALDAAKAAEKRGETRTALRQYERAMNGRGANSMKAEAAFAAARLHAKLGRSERAMSRLNRAVSLDPGHVPAQLTYAEGLIAESPDEAREHLDMVSQSTMSTQERARWHLAMGQTAGGREVRLEHLRQAERLGAPAEVIAAARAALAPTQVALQL